MGIKANIEIDSVEELRALTKADVIEVEKIVYKDRVKKIEVPTIVYKEADPKLIAKEVDKLLGEKLKQNKPKEVCLCCGSSDITQIPGSIWEYPDPSGVASYPLNETRCNTCSYSWWVNTKLIK